LRVFGDVSHRLVFVEISGGTIQEDIVVKLTTPVPDAIW
jgi:hypothetical protein